MKRENIAARYTSGRNNGERQLRLNVDGREISWQEFGRMLMSFEGWQFKLEIRDKSEDL